MDLFRILQGRKKGLLLTFIAFSIFANAQLVTYPEGLKAGMQHNDDYTVRVRVPGGEWKDLFEYNVSVDMDNVQSASMVQFDMGSPVEVMVKKNNGLIQDVQIRPLVNGIRHTVNQNTILFTLEKPRYLSVELMVTACIIFICLLILWRQKLTRKVVRTSCILDREYIVPRMFPIIK